MNRLTCLELTAGVAVPRGEEGFWQIIGDLDRQGAWTIRTIIEGTNASPQAVANFVSKLRLGGYAEVIGELPNEHNGRKLWPSYTYRLTKRPLRVPRLKADGSPLPETGTEQLWRAMKMSKAFSPEDLAEACPAVGLGTVRSYVAALVAAGIVSKAGTGRYRLARNLGARAPKILSTKLVFDPNAKAIVGTSVAREVSP